MIYDHCLMYKKADGLGFGQMQEFPKTSDQLEFFFWPFIFHKFLSLFPSSFFLSYKKQ